jgi:hypothetical protein
VNMVRFHPLCDNRSFLLLAAMTLSCPCLNEGEQHHVLHCGETLKLSFFALLAIKSLAG